MRSFCSITSKLSTQLLPDHQPNPQGLPLVALQHRHCYTNCTKLVQKIRVHSQPKGTVVFASQVNIVVVEVLMESRTRQQCRIGCVTLVYSLMYDPSLHTASSVHSVVIYMYIHCLCTITCTVCILYTVPMYDVVTTTHGCYMYCKCTDTDYEPPITHHLLTQPSCPCVS